MSRLIDADELEELFREVIGAISKEQSITKDLEHMVRASAMTIEMINDAPTVDAVPVVRCGECKNYDVETAWCKIHSCFINSNGDFCHPWESNEWKMFDGAYYCADGERRADNEAV